MNVIYQVRRTGKITHIIITSSKRQIPILCHSKMKQKHIVERARELNLNIPDPILFSFEAYDAIKDKQDVLIDDIDLFLNSVLPKYSIKSSTVSAHSIYLKMESNG